MTQHSRRPAPTEYAPHFGTYVDLVPEEDIVSVLESQVAEIESLFGSISEERSLHRYAPGKWSIREVAGHLTDGERVFAFRAVAFARGDAQPLPGFEEGDYVRNASFDSFTLRQLVAALLDQRRATLSMFRTLQPEAWSRSGIANGKSITVNALAYTMAGHLRHHFKVLRERYLS